MLLKQSTARNVPVLLVDSSDHVTGKTGLTLTVKASKDGAAFATITPTVTELEFGWYSLAFTTTHTNTLGSLAVHITGSGADPADFTAQVVAALPGEKVAVSLAAGDVTGNLPADLKAANGNTGGAAGFDRAVRGIVLGTVGSASTTTSIVTSSLSPAATVTDQFKGRIVVFDSTTTTANLRGQASDVTASTSGGVLTVSALSDAPVSGDSFTVQ